MHDSMHRSSPSTLGTQSKGVQIDLETVDASTNRNSHFILHSSSNSDINTASSDSRSSFNSNISLTSVFSRKPSISSNFRSSPKSPFHRRKSKENHSPSEYASSASIHRDLDLRATPSQDCFPYVANTSPSAVLETSVIDLSEKMLQARPGTSYQSTGPSSMPIQSTTGSSFMPIRPPSPTLETITFQHIHETSLKRISTLDYLRQAHEGQVRWFYTLIYNRSDLQRMPYFDPRKLARRATNYLLLGLSLPTVLDLYSSTPTEFLKTLNALLSEFESFQQVHPPDGSSSSSLSRGRFPQMFKRATATSSKGRRPSAAADIGLPMGNECESKVMNGNATATPNSSTSFPVSENELLPGEEYTHLLTPSLPFDPDFYETYATLCDVLIDCYNRIMCLISSPRECGPTVAEMFTKADARVRKILVQGVVKEFDENCRAGVKGELASIGKVVLGGLM